MAASWGLSTWDAEALCMLIRRTVDAFVHHSNQLAGRCCLRCHLQFELEQGAVCGLARKRQATHAVEHQTVDRPMPFDDCGEILGRGPILAYP